MTQDPDLRNAIVENLEACAANGHTLAYADDLDCVKEMIEHGALDADTDLELAAQYLHEERVRFML